MEKYTKKELINDLALSNDLESNAAAARVLDVISDSITKAVQEGKPVYWSGFVMFKPAVQAGRSGTMNGVSYDTPEKKVVKVTPTAPLKRKIEG